MGGVNERHLYSQTLTNNKTDMLNDNRKIGFGLSAGGIGFMGLGILLMFDSRLIAIGNAMFFTGVTLILGVQGTLRLFARCVLRC